MTSLAMCGFIAQLRGRNRIGRREKWPKKGWEGEIGGKSREEGEKET